MGLGKQLCYDLAAEHAALPSQFQRKVRDGYLQNFKEAPIFFLPASPQGAAQKEVGRWQLQFRALASRGQQSSTGGQVWGSWEAQPSPLQPLALGVKQVLSHPAHRNMRKAFSTTRTTLLHVGGSSTHSRTHSFSVNVL